MMIDLSVHPADKHPRCFIWKAVDEEGAEVIYKADLPGEQPDWFPRNWLAETTGYSRTEFIDRFLK